MIPNLKTEVLNYVKTNQITLLYSFLGTVLATIVLHFPNGSSLAFESLIYAFMLGLPVCFGAEYILGTDKKSFKLRTLLLGIVCIVSFGLSYILGQTTEAKMHLLACAYLLFLISPPAVRRTESVGFHWIIYVGYALGTSISISLVLLGLLSFLLWVVKTLFGIEAWPILKNIGLSFFLVFLPLNLFGLLKPKAQLVASLKYEISAVMERTIRYLFTPILFLYLGVLLSYVIKIAITASLPQGMVSIPISIAFGIFLALSSYIETINFKSEGLWKYSSLLRLLFIPLFLVMGIGIGVRISTYGFTPDRMYLVMIFLLMCAILIIRWTYGALEIRKIIFFAALLLLASSLGPLSPNEITARSQINRFVGTIAKYSEQIQNKGHFQFELWSTSDIEKSISSLETILSKDKAEQLLAKAQGFLPADIENSPEQLKTLLEHIRVSERPLPKNTQGNCKLFKSDRSLTMDPIMIQGFSYYQDINLLKNKNFTFFPYRLLVSTGTTTISLFEGDEEVLSLDYEMTLKEYDKTFGIKISLEPLIVEASRGKFALKLVIQSATFDCNEVDLNGYILIQTDSNKK